MSKLNERAALKSIIVRLIAEALMEKENGDEEVLASGDGESHGEEEVNEFSGAGAVAGFTLRLGMSPQSPPAPTKLRIRRKKKRTND